MLFWANGVIFLLYLLGITSEWRNVLRIFCLQEFVVSAVVAAAVAVAAAVMVAVEVVVIVVYCIGYIIFL